MNIDDVKEWFRIANKPQKTHNLLLLNKICSEIDVDFENIIVECGFLNRFANDIRYPNQYLTDETLTNIAIATVEKIRNFKPILDLRNIIAKIDES